ncbi:MAG TPA: hypothetical protein VG186_11335 [Solirubrobacteraceae bacterium]|nr:hypothetical protein [Solirubrobacteraceae bacterium]
MRIDAHGIAAELPHGWSGRIVRLAGGGATLHAATFTLPLDASSFGDLSTASIPVGGAFFALTEYLPGTGGLEPGAGLFASRRFPRPLDPASFSRRKLAHARPGQLATQHFFTTAGRPLCLYVVIAAPPSRGERRDQLARVNRVLASVRVAPGPG